MQEGRVMLTSMSVPRRVLSRQEGATAFRIVSLPKLEQDSGPKRGETRTKEYLLALQAQDISPAVTDEESTRNSKLKIEDIEEIVDRERTMSANIQFVTADLVVYAGVEFEDEIDGE